MDNNISPLKEATKGSHNSTRLDTNSPDQGRKGVLKILEERKREPSETADQAVPGSPSSFEKEPRPYFPDLCHPAPNRASIRGKCQRRNLEKMDKQLCPRPSSYAAPGKREQNKTLKKDELGMDVAFVSPEHPRFNAKYKDDNLKASKPFSQGPRGCPGWAIALAVLRLFVAKVLWQFDLEVAPNQDGLSFDKDFKYLAFWERPPFWVRFKPVQTTRNE